MSAPQPCEHAAAFRVPDERSRVQKDECTKCFDDAFLPGGLDVCLTCFNGGCTGDLGHAKAHARLAGHPLVLNLRQTEVPREAAAEEAPEEPARVALPASAFEAPEVKTEWTVRCHACDGGADIDVAAVPGLREAVDAVLAASSAAQTSMPKAWENTLVGCDHCLLLQQEPNAPQLASKNAAHCESCDVSDNLWLCLTCGALGCGRKLWDGSGGNGHGVAHYEATGHPVVCKMGTISPEGTADTHCYKCDEMRLDPMLVEHLGHFGIAMAEQVVTGKTMAELELQANKDMNWNTVLNAAGGEAELLFGPCAQGLKNLGNTCYLNSVLQAALRVPELAEAYGTRGQEHLDTCRSMRPADCFACQMAKVAVALRDGRYSQKREAAAGAGGDGDERGRDLQPGVSPHMLRALLVKDHEEFSTNRQQDAFEFFQYFVQQLQQKGRALGADPTPAFEFSVEQRVECTECHRVRYRHEKAQELSLPVPVSDEARQRVADEVAARAEEKKEKDGPAAAAAGDDDAAAKEQERKRRRRDADLTTAEKGVEVPFEDCLAAWSAPEPVEAYQCAHCGKRTGAVKSTRLASFPETLVVQMRRFVFDQWVPRKLGASVVLPEGGVQDLSPYFARGLQDGELEQPAEAAPAAPAADEGIVSGLMAMGFPRVRCEKAALAVDNAGVGPASEWLFAHMEDPDIDVPVQAAPAAAAAAAPVDEMAVAQLMSMGFPADRCKYALGQTQGSLDRAVDWLFSHADEPIPSGDAAGGAAGGAAAGAASASPVPVDDGRPKRYELSAVVTHLGASVHLGHYVAHLRQPDGRWALFNDTKVSVDADEASLRHGYLYFFRRVRD